MGNQAIYYGISCLVKRFSPERPREARRMSDLVLFALIWLFLAPFFVYGGWKLAEWMEKRDDRRNG